MITMHMAGARNSRSRTAAFTFVPADKIVGTDSEPYWVTDVCQKMLASIKEHQGQAWCAALKAVLVT